MSTNRRDFLQSSAFLTAATVIGSSITNLRAEEQPTATDGTKQASAKYSLPALPYSYDALEPFIDAKTLELHHDKHHDAAVQGLNKAEDELAKANAKGDFSQVDYWIKKRAFNGGSHALHSMYWKSMTPKGGGKPPDMLMKKIYEDFGNFDTFKNQFTAIAKSVEGSGWALLTSTLEGKLQIYQVEKHENFSTWNVIPIIACDVWEHAYYLKYQNKRPDYINAWWNVVNWEGGEQRYKELIERR